MIPDLRCAIRMLLKNPGFTAVAVLTLGLGIGANTVIFSSINAVWFRPLPYKEPDQLVWLFAKNQQLGYARLPPNWANETFSDFREQCQSFAQTSVLRAKDFILQSPEGVEHIRGMRASANLFDLLGVRPVLGRTFTSEENQWGRHRVVLLSYEFWQRRFGGDPAILGQIIRLIDTEVSDRTGQPHDTLDLQSYTVIGILPRRWQFPVGAGDFNFRAGELNFRKAAELWEPESLTPDEKQRRAVLDLLLARLKPGVNPRNADAEIQALYRNSGRQNEGIDGVELLPLKTQIVGSARTALCLLLGATGLVMLIACVNVANLLLARAVARQKEFAIRAALGADRFRMIRLLLAESLTLALLGGTVGLLLTYWGVHALVSFRPANLPRIEEISVDTAVLGFIFGLCLLTGLLFGLAPALRASKAGLNDALNEGGRSATAGFRRSRFQDWLVVSEVALSMVLLIGAGLLIQSFARLLQVETGYQPNQVVALRLSFENPKYTNNLSSLLVEQLLERMGKLPGVRSAAATSWVPIEGGRERFEAYFQIEGRPAPRPGSVENLTVARMSFVTPNYFKTMGIPILRGRDFSREDLTPGALIAKIVSESFARKYFPNEDPLGKRLGAVGGRGEIIGVVKDTLESALDTQAAPHLYHAGIAGLRDVSIVVKTERDLPELSAALRKEVAALDTDQPLSAVTPMKQILSGSVAERRFQMMLLGLFAGIAFLLAMVGMYGVIAYAVSQRTHEIGIRMALGSQRGAVIKLMIRDGMKQVAVGLGVGLVGAFAATRLLASQLFGVTATDPATFAEVALVFVSAAFMACWLPARRAAKVEPLEALRHE